VGLFIAASRYDSATSTEKSTRHERRGTSWKTRRAILIFSRHKGKAGPTHRLSSRGGVSTTIVSCRATRPSGGRGLAHRRRGPVCAQIPRSRGTQTSRMGNRQGSRGRKAERCRLQSSANDRRAAIRSSPDRCADFASLAGDGETGAAQGQRIEHDNDRGQAHEQGPDLRAQQNAERHEHPSGCRDGERIVAERPE
jgi:hypothetical protein